MKPIESFWNLLKTLLFGAFGYCWVLLGAFGWVLLCAFGELWYYWGTLVLLGAFGCFWCLWVLFGVFGCFGVLLGSFGYFWVHWVLAETGKLKLTIASIDHNLVLLMKASLIGTWFLNWTLPNSKSKVTLKCSRWEFLNWAIISKANANWCLGLAMSANSPVTLI